LYFIAHTTTSLHRDQYQVLLPGTVTESTWWWPGHWPLSSLISPVICSAGYMYTNNSWNKLPDPLIRISLRPFNGVVSCALSYKIKTCVQW